MFGLVAMERKVDEVVIRLHGGHGHCVTAPIYSVRRDHPLWIPHRYVEINLINMQLQHQEIAIMTAQSMCISPVIACFG